MVEYEDAFFESASLFFEYGTIFELQTENVLHPQDPRNRTFNRIDLQLGRDNADYMQTLSSTNEVDKQYSWRL